MKTADRVALVEKVTEAVNEVAATFEFRDDLVAWPLDRGRFRGALSGRMAQLQHDLDAFSDYQLICDAGTQPADDSGLGFILALRVPAKNPAVPEFLEFRGVIGSSRKVEWLPVLPGDAA